MAACRMKHVHIDTCLKGENNSGLTLVVHRILVKEGLSKPVKTELRRLVGGFLGQVKAMLRCLHQFPSVNQRIRAPVDLCDLYMA